MVPTLLIAELQEAVFGLYSTVTLAMASLTHTPFVGYTTHRMIRYCYYLIRAQRRPRGALGLRKAFWAPPLKAGALEHHHQPGV